MTPESLGLAQWLALAVAAQRIAELLVARRNTARLMQAGAIETGRRHYGLIVALHAAWLAAVFLYIAPTAPVHYWLIAVFVLLQAARLWVIRSLGRFWTTRIVTLPDAPLVAKGPYRWLRHPNYAIVALELAILPLAFEAWAIALAFSVCNAIAMAIRIPAENRALALRGQVRPGTTHSP